MIVGGRMLQGKIQRGGLNIRPEPTAEQIQPASIDLTMGASIYDPASDTTQQVDPGRPITLAPGAFLLGHTREVVELPSDLAAQVAGRSTFGRLGIGVHVTAGWIDPGFEGDITLELANHAPWPVDIYPGERVAQLVFHQVVGGGTYSGSYQGQRGPKPAVRRPQPTEVPEESVARMDGGGQ